MKDTKTAVINIRCTKEQKARIKKLAKECEISISKMILNGY